MKRRLLCENDRQSKQVKIQRTITSMFRSDCPKFVEATGVQLICPYCGHKFRAPQGLISHKYMHERAGDKFLPKVKPNVFKFSSKPNKPGPPEIRERKSPMIAPVSPPSIPPVDGEGTELEDSAKQASPKDLVSPNTLKSMTRRFSIAEKLEIIDKSKELNNKSATCR